ncbi:MAG: sulfatase-like hydrolase/transferase, partial [bacterium]|nr:sulfatase-like hydrolase/transferase [bacterium]
MELALTADAAPLTFAVEGPKNGFFLWGAPFLDPPRPSPRTSIVLITLDTTRRDALGVYGGDRGVTPHLDELAGSATVFERAYAPAPWTLPSHASIFTGLYPSKHGAGVAADHLESRFETLPELLRRHGYLTAGFGGGMLTSYRFG